MLILAEKLTKTHHESDTQNASTVLTKPTILNMKSFNRTLTWRSFLEQ